MALLGRGGVKRSCYLPLKVNLVHFCVTDNERPITGDLSASAK